MVKQGPTKNDPSFLHHGDRKTEVLRRSHAFNAPPGGTRRRRNHDGSLDDCEKIRILRRPERRHEPPAVEGAGLVAPTYSGDRRS